jgi:hypothetical protein
MEYWEFLIQREGDRSWRSIKTGNLQLTEGKYRIIANSNILDTPIQTRVTHQALGSKVPQRRSQSRIQTTNDRGLVVIAPFTDLHSGIWQFVCSGSNDDRTAWHRILKLRVLSRTNRSVPAHSQQQVESVAEREIGSPSPSPQRSVAVVATQPNPTQISDRQVANVDDSSDLGTPTAPIVPISMLDESVNWADGLDRLLEQLERDSLQTLPPLSIVQDPFLGTIQLNTIADPPLQLISLARSTFSSMIPGHRLTIAGACNLQLLNTNLVQTVKIEKLSICLRHPQTSEIIAAIEQSIPPQLDTFTFSGRIELPPEPKITLLLGEVSLYDKHHIQIGSSGFTVTLNLNPLQESERSLFQFFDRHQDNTPATVDYRSETLRQRLNQELQLEAVMMTPHGTFSQPAAPKITDLAKLDPGAAKPTENGNSPEVAIPRLNSPHSTQYPAVPLTYRRESCFTHPDIISVEPAAIDRPPSPEDVVGSAQTHLHDRYANPSQPIATDITGDLELDFSHATIGRSLLPTHRHDRHRNYENLEIVIDD